jgi:hypothetical protein
MIFVEIDVSFLQTFNYRKTLWAEIANMCAGIHKLLTIFVILSRKVIRFVSKFKIYLLTPGANVIKLFFVRKLRIFVIS